jgi:hypothetical protein
MTRTFVLNINLKVIGSANRLHECTDRAFRAIEVLREFDRDLKARRDITENEDGPEITLDDVLIVQLNTPQLNAFFKRLRELSDELEQEAIAVYEGYRPGFPPGHLVGKRACAWGPFRLDRMKFIDPEFKFTTP